ncbi:tRNA (adenine(22)-N(1))-methyltransferase TrmK [Tumebacillus sp. ITR2]|uniref:tRNA (Adenine(22)-N(1))-methyltransferase TrmK n=1 Tax=Tumebacillus amylolyticus TaxID=2801339 RepID=A0ABS1JDH7_9BACL|nr:class I SAM-dependent methyltransferase [Tumebacillus amylolyticus]MBL0388332.1 tRNA (adenine(22)-N(1))-methyltransferase TrmK [Tumebacillus amylolyticus]
MNLSERLERIASNVPPNVKVADIGSDHAYLPIYLVQKGIATSAVAGEVNDGPFKGADRHVRENGLADFISVRKGDGLAVLQPGEVDVITIAGMGGYNIREILEAGKEKLVGVTRLVLSPQGDSDRVRIWLQNHGWKLIDEDILTEDERIYEILVAERGEMNITDPMQLEFGPFNLERKHPRVIDRVDYEQGKIRRALASIEKAPTENGLARKEELLARRAQLEEVRNHVQS